MEKLSVEKKVGIIKQYFSGLSYDEIAAKTGISKGSIANIITELKAGKFPEALTGSDQIELLRELSLDLKQSKLTPGQCVVGIAVLNRIKEFGLETADIDRWPLILKSAGNADQVPEFIRLVYDIQAVMKNKGMSLEDLHDNVLELEKKAAALEPMSKQCEDYKKQITDLSGQCDSFTVTVSQLKKEFELLNPRVKDTREHERQLSDRVKDLETRAAKAEASIVTGNKEKKRLLEMGLPLDALTEFNDRVQSVAHRHHIIATEMKDRLFHELQRLDEGLTLEALVQECRHQLAELEKAINSAKQEKGALSSVVSDLKQEKINLEIGIKNTREKIVGELAKLVPVTKEMVNGFLVELRQDREKALDEMSRLRDETLEVGKEIGKYEATLQVNQWLKELLALVRGDESVEGKRVRAITLLVLRGIAAWLKHNKVNNLAVSNLAFTSDTLITEFERWKA